MLTGNQPELTKTLFDKQQADSSLKELSGFAQFTKGDWKNFITESNITNFPEGINGSTNEEKIEQYAASLESLMQLLYPVDVFAKRLEKDTSAHWGSVKQDLLKFLINNKSFNLKTNNIKKEFAAANFTGIIDRTALEDEMKKINRLYKLSDKQEHVSALRAAGVGSATELVTKFSPIQFSKTFSSVFGSTEAAKAFYNKAKSVDKKATAIAANIKLSYDVQPYAMKQSLPDNEMNDVFKELFKPDGLCECEECTSLYSPAAYFVDILKFIKDHNETAFNELTVNRRPEVNRRPDLVNINLTCHNTNTPIPYIDLVNELLENEVAGTDEIYQIEGDAADIQAMPEHVNSAAYDKLKVITGNAILSLALPLDLSLEVLRLYLDKLGYKRYALMELFYGKKEPGKYKDVSIAAEYLQFTLGEITILTGSDSFGIAIPDTIAKLIQTLGVSYIELLQLLETYFLNPLNGLSRFLSIVAISTDPNKAATCDLDGLMLNGADAPWMDKAVRFIRLWRKTGWNVFDLDRFLMALDINSFDDFENKILVPLSHVVRIQNLIDLPVREIFSFWFDIDTAVYHDHSIEGQPAMPTLYEKLFQNKQVTNPVDTDFNLPFDSDTEELLLLSEKAETIIAALNLSQNDFELLTISFTDDTLNLQNLSILFRYAIFARTLRISLSDLIRLIDITTINPFADLVGTEEMLIFLDTISLLKSSGYSVNDLSVLSGKTPSATEQPDIKTISDLFISLREGLKKIALLFPDASNDIEEANKKLQNLNSFIADTLSTALKTESKLTTVLINNVVKSTADLTLPAIAPFINDAFINSERPVFSLNNSNEIVWLFPDLYFTYIEVSNTWKRISRLISKFKITTDEFIYFQKDQDTLDINDIWNLPNDNPSNLYTSFENLYNLIRFRNALAKSVADWYTLFDYAKGNDKTNFISSFIDLTGIDQSTVEFLIGEGADTNQKGALNFSFPEDYTNGACLLNIVQCARFAASLQTSVMTN